MSDSKLSHSNGFNPYCIEYSEDHPNYSRIDEIDLQKIIENGYPKRFLKKTKYWKYEKEFRFFGQPGKIKCCMIGLELKGILLSGRFESDNLSVLKAINRECYDDKLCIKSYVTKPQGLGLRVIKEKCSCSMEASCLNEINNLLETETSDH